MLTLYQSYDSYMSHMIDIYIYMYIYICTSLPLVNWPIPVSEIRARIRGKWPTLCCHCDVIISAARGVGKGATGQGGGAWPSLRLFGALQSRMCLQGKCSWRAPSNDEKSLQWRPYDALLGCSGALLALVLAILVRRWVLQLPNFPDIWLRYSLFTWSSIE